jgi:acetyl-CoA acetyltransferase family protein
METGVLDAVIVDAVQSPIGKGRIGSALSARHPVDLLADVLVGLVERTGIDPDTVDDVLIGCVSQGSEQGGCPGRMAWLGAGFPTEDPAVTIDRRCGSSQQAVHFAAQGVMSGQYEIAIAGGVESMSRVPMGSARQGTDMGGRLLRGRYPDGLVPQGVSAEIVANRWNITREDLDAFALRSQQLAAEASKNGDFDAEIVPITVQLDDGSSHIVTVDETIRPGTTRDGLAGLVPVFQTDECVPFTAQRAYELGLVNRVVPDEQAAEHAIELAELIATNGPLAVAASKRVAIESADWTGDVAFARQEEFVDPVRRSSDAAEGARAFIEKREPVWVDG